jgi:hypothetical protein
MGRYLGYQLVRTPAYRQTQLQRFPHPLPQLSAYPLTLTDLDLTQVQVKIV